MLRPATFAQLGQTLRAAKAAGAPYHVVHFDGHGLYGEGSGGGAPPSRLIFADHRPGKHGYLAFENAATEDNLELVPAQHWGRC